MVWMRSNSIKKEEEKKEKEQATEKAFNDWDILAWRKIFFLLESFVSLFFDDDDD